MLSPIVIGAGPAGLSAAYRLSTAGIPVCVLEKDTQCVGGISRTINWNGFRFDIGGHRFFTKSEEVDGFWSTLLGDDFLPKKRLSRIFYQGQYFSYPLDVAEVLRKLGSSYAVACLLSYTRAKLSPREDSSTYENWMVNCFGEVLFETFFRSYTEKVWGISCTDISADWAAQRTKGVHLRSILKKWLFDRKRNSNGARSFVEEFRYPRLGAGQAWEAAASRIESHGSKVLLGVEAREVVLEKDGLVRVSVRHQDGKTETLETRDVVSSMPTSDLLKILKPMAPEDILSAAKALRYRDFILVALKIKKASLFPDQWIYVHDPRVRVGRIQDFRNWSPDLVPDTSHGLIGLEYFCFENEDFWQRSDVSLIAQAIAEAELIGILHKDEIEDGFVVRVPKAYPLYEHGYKQNFRIVRDYIASVAPGIQLIGRNGLHRYNNQDHSVMTGFLAAQNIIEGTRQYDPMRVNEDADYLEEGR